MTYIKQIFFDYPRKNFVDFLEVFSKRNRNLCASVSAARYFLDFILRMIVWSRRTQWESREKKSNIVTKSRVITVRWKAEFEVKGEGKIIFIFMVLYGTLLEKIWYLLRRRRRLSVVLFLIRFEEAIRLIVESLVTGLHSNNGYKLSKQWRERRWNTWHISMLIRIFESRKYLSRIDSIIFHFGETNNWK